jgi:CRISPR-associated protein Csd1
LEPRTDREEARKVKDQLEVVAQGRAVSELSTKDIDPGTRFYILGLAPNAARLSVRFWYDCTFGDLEQRIRDHWQDMAITPLPKVWPPSAQHLLIETAAQHDSKNIPPLLGGELMRAILNGTRYPRSLMSAVLVRIRAEQGKVTAMRAAILRGILTREYRLGFEQKEVPMALDENDTNPAYRLGRWFAELEAIQQHALPGLNATIRDRFYGSASSAPARTFPVLIRNAMNHLAGLRKDGKAGGHEKRLEAIIAGVEHGLPRSLRIEDQARFAIGYYHQRADRFTKSSETKDTATGEEITS